MCIFVERYKGQGQQNYVLDNFTADRVTSLLVPYLSRTKTICAGVKGHVVGRITAFRMDTL